MRIEVKRVQDNSVAVYFVDKNKLPVIVSTSRFPDLSIGESREYELVPVRKGTRKKKRWIVKNPSGVEHLWETEPTAEIYMTCKVFGPFDVEVEYENPPIIKEGWFSKADSVCSGPWHKSEIHHTNQIYGKFIEMDPPENDES